MGFVPLYEYDPPLKSYKIVFDNQEDKDTCISEEA